MVGEEAVTLDIVPLLRCMSDLGRLEDTMYLAMFAMEEAKHTEMFRRWFDAVGMDPASLDDIVRARAEALGTRPDGQPRAGVFDGALTRVMRRLDTDKSPQAILDASIIYNQLVEGVMAIAGYQRWDETFRELGKLPGLEAGLKLTQRDERRHIAYGTYLGRRVLAENPELWEWLEKRWAKLTASFNGGGYGAADSQGPQNEVERANAELMERYQRLSKRRLEALAVARTMNVTEVDASAVEAFEPEELQHA
jgi:ribonucleoside-diphosphate reductase beta chain